MILKLLPAVLWVGLILLILVHWHIPALRRYKAQMDIAMTERMDPALGVIAKNQHFRYMVRCYEAGAALAIGVLGVAVVFDPDIVRTPGYSIFVLLFLFGTQAATGWLSQRDLHTLDKIDRLDEELGLA
jgi:hypothetical protein